MRTTEQPAATADTAKAAPGVISQAGSALYNGASYTAWASFFLVVAHTAYTQYRQAHPELSEEDAFTFVTGRLKDTYGWCSTITREQLTDAFTQKKDEASSYLVEASSYFNDWYEWGSNQWTDLDSDFNTACSAFKSDPVGKLIAMGSAAGTYVYDLMGQPKTLQELAPFAANLLLVPAAGTLLGALGVPFAGGISIAASFWNKSLDPDLVEQSGAKGISGTASTLTSVAKVIKSLPVIGGLIPTVASFAASIAATGYLSPKVMGYLTMLTSIDNMSQFAGLSVPPLAYAAVIALGDPQRAKKLTGAKSDSPIIETISNAVISAIKSAPSAILSPDTRDSLVVQIQGMTAQYSKPAKTTPAAPFCIDDIRLVNSADTSKTAAQTSLRKSNKDFMEKLAHGTPLGNGVLFKPYFPPTTASKKPRCGSFSLGPNHNAQRLKVVGSITGNPDHVIVIGNTATVSPQAAKDADTPAVKGQVRMPYAEARVAKSDTPPASEKAAHAEKTILLLETLTMMLTLQTGEPHVHQNLESIIGNEDLQLNIIVDDPKIAQLLYHQVRYLAQAHIESKPPLEQQAIMVRLNGQIFVGKEQADGLFKSYSTEECAALAHPLEGEMQRLLTSFNTHIFPTIQEHTAVRKPTKATPLDHVKKVRATMSDAFYSKTAVGPDGAKAPRATPEFAATAKDLASQAGGYVKDGADWALKKGVPMATAAAGAAVNYVGTLWRSSEDPTTAATPADESAAGQNAHGHTA
jgi:hypothetical protein